MKGQKHSKNCQYAELLFAELLYMNNFAVYPKNKTLLNSFLDKLKKCFSKGNGQRCCTPDKDDSPLNDDELKMFDILNIKNDDDSGDYGIKNDDDIDNVITDR